MLKDLVENKNNKQEPETNKLICLNISPVQKQHGENASIPVKTLTSGINYIEKINPYGNSNLGLLQIEENLRDEKIRTLIYELANAVDKNSVSEIKNLKKLYGTSKEFAKAKSFLNDKCKEVWNVFDNKKTKLQLPHAAMQALGITNQPDLSFLLDNSLKHFEKQNSAATVDIIKSVLNNVNIEYSFEDIAKYLKNAHQKRNFEYNPRTVEFLAVSVNFKKKKLDYMEISPKQINNIFKGLTVKEKFNCIKNYYFAMYC